MKVVAPTEELQVIAENRLDEVCHATPAISNGRLYVRGDQHLYSIGAKAEPASATE